MNRPGPSQSAIWYRWLIRSRVKDVVARATAWSAACQQVLAAGAELRQAFVRGVAAASAALLASGTGLCQPADVERLQAQMTVQDL